MRTRDIPESLGPGPIGLKNLVAMTASRRRPLERLASEDLGLAAAVRISRVEEIDARVKRQIDDPLGLLLVGAVAKGHGTKANFRYFEAGAAHSAVFHCSFLVVGFRRTTVLFVTPAVYDK